MEQADELRLLTKVARLYHARGLRQVDIAQRLRLSQPRVSRLLQQAEQLGVVRNVVAAPPGLHSDLEEALVGGYGLAAAHVIDAVADDEDELTHDLGHATARFMAAHPEPAPTIGFTSWSRTFRHMVAALSPVRLGTERVVEMLGDLGSPKVQQETAHMTQRLAALTGGQPTFLRVPGVVSSPDMREAILSRDPHAREALTLLDAMDIALIGAGPCEVVAPLTPGDNFFTQEQFDHATRHGAVGQLCLRFLDADGASVDTPMDELVIGVTLNQLRAARSRWMAAGGPSKYAIVRAALIGQWVNCLVTDTVTATHLVSLAQGDAGRNVYLTAPGG